MNQKELLQNILDYRKEHDTFKKSLDQRSEKFHIATYDGPPFASGTPHFGHGLTSTMKDSILRYKTMKGYKVNRDRGWDCHGLPVEKAVEKELGLDGKKDIEQKIGIEKFIEACRSYVSSTSDERKIFVDQLGRWADMDHAYYTMDLSFMESVIWVFQNMYSQNLVYKGFNIQWYCPSCATSLSNSEVNEGYQDKQDPAITIKFKISKTYPEQKFETTDDGFIEVVDCALKRDNKFFMFYHKKAQKYVFPGGKLDLGDSLEKTVKKELSEEVGGIEVTSIKPLGSFKEILPYGLFNLNVIDVEFTGEPQNLEPEKHTHFVRAEIIPSDNSLGMAVKIENTVMDDEHEIISQFYDLYIYHKQIPQKIAALTDNKNAGMNVLAWTTTPWTLPSNMFLAVGKHIDYAIVFDVNTKEYYVLAESLLKAYYKDASEYFFISRVKGEQIVGTAYEPLLPYISKSKISQNYKDQFFKIIAGDFVSTEDGTGIVHIAPSFGQDDFNAVAAFLPRQDAKNWLFLPVNDYGEFTDEVPEYKGTRVYEANKDIITRLKQEGKLIGQKSYNHSYPHCRRCDTPLISKALTSWFIKEQELSSKTVPHVEDINFVPGTVKNRFRDTLSSAPDWNLARNRYRGSPIPVWENTKDEEDKIVVGTLEELFHHTQEGSKNITKNIFVRHGKSTYNPEQLADSKGKPILNEEGKKQAQNLIESLPAALEKDMDDVIFIISPLQRAFLTIAPFLEKTYGKKEFSSIQNKYEEITKIYQKLYDDKEIFDYVRNPKKQQRFEIGKNIYVDFRAMEMFLPDFQDEYFDGKKLLRNDKKPGKHSESPQELFARAEDYVLDINKEFATKTIVTVSHYDATLMMMKRIRNFDYDTKKLEYGLKNATFKTFYWDNTRNTEVDLHKPYIDSYWFEKKGKTYKRIPEVMDCWFESGSMPFGQCGYVGHGQTKPFAYPADFIIEGLDQTRGWFRTMHVIGNAIMNKNSFNNVIINGLVLAEDGHKMSKKLKNYPDPLEIFARYGSDAYRLYLLSSPVVRAEPVRFSEKGVDQIYKDFTSSLLNTYKFFETYAKVDGFQSASPSIYFLRHAKADTSGNLTKDGIAFLETPEFIENILRTQADVIYCSTLPRAMQTAEKVQKIFQEYRGKEVGIIYDERLATEGKTIKSHEEILKNHSGGSVLIIAHEPNAQELWTAFYEDKKLGIHTGEIIKIPAYKITNELDKWILAALHQMGKELEQHMDYYLLDNAAKVVLGFVDKLNNRYIRRSRRRFRATGMDGDKFSAYSTLLEVLETYLKFVAPFAPFISEHLFLEIQKNFKKTSEIGDSIHLHHLPLSSTHYINENLLEEITLMRRIISLGLFIRSKNKIAIKQPLQKIELKIN